MATAPVTELLDIIVLRNRHRIYRKDGGFWVVQEGRHGEEYAHPIPAQVVRFVEEQLKGLRVTAADTADFLAQHAERLGLPFTHGHKLYYYAIDVLLVLVALHRAVMEKVSNGYYYTISPGLTDVPLPYPDAETGDVQSAD